MADELARSNEFPFEQRIAEAVSMGIPIEEIAQHFSDSKDKNHKLWLQQYKGLQVAERARERTGQTAEPNLTAEQSTLAKAQKLAEENPITTAALATGAAGLAAGGAYAIKERIKSNAEIRKERELAKIIPPGVQQQREELDFRKQQFAAEQEKLIRAETDNAIKTSKQGQLAAAFEQKFNIPFAQAEQFSNGKITNSQDAEIIGNILKNKLSAAVNPIPGAVSNQPAGVPNAVSPMSQLRQPPAAPAGAAAPAAPMQAGPQPSQFDLAQLGQSRDPLAGRGFQQPAVPPQAAPEAAPVTPPASFVAQRTRRNAEQIAADREALLASAPEGRLPSTPNPKKSNKLMPGDVVGQGGWHWYQGQMGPAAEENWLRTFGRTNVPVKDVQQAMKEGRLAGPVVPEGKQGGAFPREATVPNYIKGHASVGGLLNVAGNALGFVGLEHEYEKAKKTGDWSDFGLGVANQLIGNIAPRLVAPTALMTPGSLNANEEEELARRRKISKIGIAPPGR
jgi:hypothetical protein